MEACCRNHDEQKAAGPTTAVAEKGCCEACPDAGCEGCACSKPQNTTGGCMGGGCGCGNGR